MTNRQQLYECNKAALLHTKIECPVCGNVFEKIQYSQAFCSRKCKDAFWNDKGDRHAPGYYEQRNSRQNGW